MAAITGTDIVRTARQYEWVAYVWGGSNPQTGWDCSGFCNWIFGGIYHLAIPGVGPGQFNTFSGHGPVVADWIQWVGVTRGVFGPVTPAPGDLVAWGPNQHMGIAISSSRMVAASNPMIGTIETDIATEFSFAPYVLRPLEILIGATAPLGTIGYTPPAANSMTDWSDVIILTRDYAIKAASNLAQFAAATRKVQ